VKCGSGAVGGTLVKILGTGVSMRFIFTPSSRIKEILDRKFDLKKPRVVKKKKKRRYLWRNDFLGHPAVTPDRACGRILPNDSDVDMG